VSFTGNNTIQVTNISVFYNNLATIKAVSDSYNELSTDLNNKVSSTIYNLQKPLFDTSTFGLNIIDPNGSPVDISTINLVSNYLDSQDYLSYVVRITGLLSTGANQPVSLTFSWKNTNAGNLYFINYPSFTFSSQITNKPFFLEIVQNHTGYTIGKLKYYDHTGTESHLHAINIQASPNNTNTSMSRFFITNSSSLDTSRTLSVRIISHVVSRC
jgi:hypothetical protein